MKYTNLVLVNHHYEQADIQATNFWNKYLQA